MKSKKKKTKGERRKILHDLPTQYLGGTASNGAFSKVMHTVPMLSLQDVFTFTWKNGVFRCAARRGGHPGGTCPAGIKLIEMEEETGNHDKAEKIAEITDHMISLLSLIHIYTDNGAGNKILSYV